MSATLLGNITAFVISIIFLDLIYRKIILVPFYLSIRYRLEELADKIYAIKSDRETSGQFTIVCDKLMDRLHVEAEMTPYLSVRLILLAYFLGYKNSEEDTVFESELDEIRTRSPEFDDIHKKRISLIKKCCKLNTPILYLAAKIYKKLFNTVPIYSSYLSGALKLYTEKLKKTQPISATWFFL